MGIVNQSKVSRACEVLNAAREEVVQLLADTPDLAVRADNVLKRLVEGLVHTTMLAPSNAPTETREREPLKTFLGKPVPQAATKTREALEAVEPTKTDLDFAREKVDKAYIAIPALSADDIREFYEDAVIRGVAKRAGLDVTTTTPKHLTNAFIESIKTAIANKAAAEAKVNEVEKQAAEIIEDSKDAPYNSPLPEFKNPPTPPAEPAEVEQTGTAAAEAKVNEVEKPTEPKKTAKK